VPVDGAAPDPRPSSQRPGGPAALSKALEVLAGAAQALVLMSTFLLGLGWGGWTYPVAVGQAAVAFVPLLRLAGRRRLGWALLVPVVSAALTAGLLAGGDALGHTGA
jgi:hypothetical protein